VHGDDHRRRLRVALDLLAQLGDVLVEGAGGAEVVDPPDQIEEAVAAEDFAGAGEEGFEELHLPGGEAEADFPASPLIALAVDFGGADMENFRELRHGIGVDRRGAAQDGRYPGPQLVEAEGFGDVVVGAEFEAEDLVDFLPLGGEHDDRHAAVGLADGAADLEAVFLRHHNVEEEEVGALGEEDLEGFGTVGGGKNAVPFGLEGVDQSQAQVGVVFGDENGDRLHGSAPGAGRVISKQAPISAAQQMSSPP